MIKHFALPILFLNLSVLGHAETIESILVKGTASRKTSTLPEILKPSISDVEDEALQAAEKLATEKCSKLAGKEAGFLHFAASHAVGKPKCTINPIGHEQAAVQCQASWELRCRLPETEKQLENQHSSPANLCSKVKDDKYYIKIIPMISNGVSFQRCQVHSNHCTTIGEPYYSVVKIETEASELAERVHAVSQPRLEAEKRDVLTAVIKALKQTESECVYLDNLSIAKVESRLLDATFFSASIEAKDLNIIGDSLPSKPSVNENLSKKVTSNSLQKKSNHKNKKYLPILRAD